MARTRTQIVGYISIDSGMVMLGDPGYVIEAEIGKMRWDDFLRQYCPDRYHRVWAVPHGAHRASGISLAIVTGTGDGDGCYPVTATFDTDGRVRKLTVSFK